jgi:DNA-binding MarR family transcriptional regulator
MTNKTLVLDQYFPFFLGTIANRWSSTSSKLYLEQFGIGIATWRVLASIQAKGQATSLDVANHIAMDTAAVSRAVAQLDQEQYISRVEGRFPGRTRPYALTPAGKRLYTSIMKLALKREALLLTGLTAQEQQELIRLMQRVLQNLDRL